MKKLLVFNVCLFIGTTLFAQSNYVATSPGSITPGSANTIVGVRAGGSLTAAQENVMIGYEAGYSNKSSRGNVYIGYAAASGDTSKGIGESVYIGSEVAFNMKRGHSNVLIGYRAGRSLNVVDESVIMGYNAAGSMGGGFGNVLIGENAATSYTGLLRTVCLGQLAGTGRIIPSPTAGDEGTYIGFEAAGVDNLTNATAIGARTRVSVSNALVLGDSVRGTKVGIGVTAPMYTLDVKGVINLRIGGTIKFSGLTNPSLYNGATDRFLTVNANGETVLAKHRLRVDSPSDWADRVFARDYRLQPLAEVEEFIHQHHHLPGIPSAEEVAEKGVDATNITVKLLEKIEELTLHMIELQKENKALRQLVESRTSGK